MTRVTGMKVKKFIENTKDKKLKNKLALNMFKAWYVPFYEYGIIHGDPHLGNYTIREDAGLNLLDFGCIRIFKPEFVSGVIDLYRAIRENDNDLAVYAYERWGFKNPTKKLIEVLNIWATFVYQPLLEDKIKPISEMPTGQYGRKTAEKVHKELKKIGGVKPPREFVLMDRAAVGLGSVFMHLKAEINWYRVFHELISEFDENKLAKKQKRLLTKVGHNFK
tara:strand:- start:167 stop:829 length:663 start_codon:yes stop_codon:yes gene_type:complete